MTRRRVPSGSSRHARPRRVALELTPFEAIGIVGFLAGLTVLPTPYALGWGAAAAGLASLNRARGWPWLLRASALALVVGAIGAAVLGSSRPTMRWHWEQSASDVASANDPVGYYPARPALVCTSGSLCEAGQRPLLNALVFGTSFPQGIRDERRFLAARVIQQGLPAYITSDLSPVHDPLRVAPGDEIEVTGIIDNAGAGSEASATARYVRALLAFPEGAGIAHALLASVSSPSTNPTAVSDSVLIESRVPTYLRYEPGSAVVLAQHDSVHYELPDRFLAPYHPDHLDRRALAGHGARVGCSKPDGILPAGRSCALRFRARFAVRYAASAIDVNGLGGIAQGFSEVTGIVRGEDEIPLYWAPYRGDPSYFLPNGRDVAIDCVLYTDTGRWYHVADVAKLRDGPIYGYDTAFIRGRNVVDIRNTPNDCFV